MPKLRVLCIGFSVTEMVNSYVPRAQKISEQEDLQFEFHRCGIGGVGVETLVYLIEDILRNNPGFDRFIFEIATGSGRNEFSERRHGINDISLMRCIKEIGMAAIRQNKPFGFLNLPRLDVDYAVDIMELAVFATADYLGVPVCSISYKALFGSVDLCAMLPDKVHANELGAEFYARSLIEFASRDFVRRESGQKEPQRYFAASLADHADSVAVAYFVRHGFGAQLIEVRPGRKLTWHAVEPVRISGVTFLSGPTSGRFLVTIDGRSMIEINSFDQYCYYDRFNSAFFAPVTGTKLEIEVLPEIPIQSLIKGEANPDRG